MKASISLSVLIRQVERGEINLQMILGVLKKCFTECRVVHSYGNAANQLLLKKRFKKTISILAIQNIKFGLYRYTLNLYKALT